MFEFVQFWFYVLQMRRNYYAAERAENEERTFRLLRKARQAGCAALQIRSPLIHERWRAVMKKNLIAVHGLYLRWLTTRIPEEDLEVVSYALRTMKVWADMGIEPNAQQMTSFANIFAYDNYMLMNNDKEMLGIIYCGKNVFPPLRNIMQPFLAGEATREETEKRLDECAEKLRKWLPELFLFPDESPLQ